MVDSGQPEAVCVAIVVAGPSAVTLDEGRAPELLETGARRGQSLTRALSTCTGVLLEREVEGEREEKKKSEIKRKLCVDIVGFEYVLLTHLKRKT